MDAGQKTGGLFDTLKNSIKPDMWAEKIRDSKDTLMEVGIFTIAGVIAGFLFKRYSKYFIVVVAIIGLLFILHTNKVVLFSVNYAKINEFCGTNMSPTSESWLVCSVDWVKEHVMLTLSFIIGFLFGIRIG